MSCNSTCLGLWAVVSSKAGRTERTSSAPYTFGKCTVMEWRFSCPSTVDKGVVVHRTAVTLVSASGPDTRDLASLRKVMSTCPPSTNTSLARASG